MEETGSISSYHLAFYGRNGVAHVLLSEQVAQISPSRHAKGQRRRPQSIGEMKLCDIKKSDKALRRICEEREVVSERLHG
jgi:hypothetical protein